MDVNIFKSEMRSRISTLTQKELRFTKSYIENKSLKAAAEYAGIAYSSVSVVKKKICQVMIGEIGLKGKRCSVNKRSKYSDIEWETRQRLISYLLDKLCENTDYADAITNKTFVVEMLVGLVTITTDVSHESNTSTEQHQVNDDTGDTSEIHKDTEDTEDTEDNTEDVDEEAGEEEGSYNIQKEPESDPFIPVRTRMEYQRSYLADLLGQSEAEKEEKVTIDNTAGHDISSRVIEQQGIVNNLDTKPSTDNSNITRNTNIEPIYASTFYPITIRDTFIINEVVRIFGNVTVLVLQEPENPKISWVYQAVRQALEGSQHIKIKEWDKPEYEYNPYGNKIHIKPIGNDTDMVNQFRNLELIKQLSSGYKEIYIPLPADKACISQKQVLEICKHGGDIKSLLPGNVATQIIQNILGGKR